MSATSPNGKSIGPPDWPYRSYCWRFCGSEEDLVGGRDLLESVLGVVRLAHVGVVLAREAAVRAPDVLLGGVSGDPGISYRSRIAMAGYAPSSVASSDRRRATARTEAMTET